MMVLLLFCKSRLLPPAVTQLCALKLCQFYTFCNHKQLRIGYMILYFRHSLFFIYLHCLILTPNEHLKYYTQEWRYFCFFFWINNLYLSLKLPKSETKNLFSLDVIGRDSMFNFEPSHSICLLFEKYISIPELSIGVYKSNRHISWTQT